MTSYTGPCDSPPSLWPHTYHLPLPFACHGYARGLQAPLPIRPVTGAVAVWPSPGGQIAQVSVTASAPFFLHTGTQLTMADSPHKGQAPPGRGPSMLSGLTISPLKRPTLPADISHKWGLQPLPGTVCCPGNVGRNLGPRASQSCKTCPFPSCEPASPST